MLPTECRGRVNVIGIGRGRGRVLLVTAVALGLAPIAGCSNGGGANASRPEKPVLNVAVVPAVDSAGFFVALDRGLFKAQGLTVNFNAADSSETAIAGQVAGHTTSPAATTSPISRRSSNTRPTWTSSPRGR
jgi:ABC-type nitrate/sulfonate/bicarbonate transport system substrate-binding protein